MSRCVIADLIFARSIVGELVGIEPDSPELPVKPRKLPRLEERRERPVE